MSSVSVSIQTEGDTAELHRLFGTEQKELLLATRGFAATRKGILGTSTILHAAADFAKWFSRASI
jgi:hypothetical protein